MKNLSFIAILLLFALRIQAQNSLANSPKLSANFQQFLLQDKSIQNTSVISHDLNGITYLSFLIKVNEVFSEHQLISCEALIGTKAKSIWTVWVPLHKLDDFIQIKNIEFIQMDEPVIAQMDKARLSTRVDSAHKGINLPTGYSGKNVIIGIIDAGFDYSHPDFYDTLGRNLRIKRVWEQKVAGNPPQGYAYGNEIIDTTEMLKKGTEITTFSHGSHVAGIAAGSGFGGPNNKYRGMAYESELVFVGIRPEKQEWKSMGMSSIIDGINYIFNYAASVGKPAVVNLSWGCSIGPNDGSSLFSQACDNLTGPGKIFSLSAGNNGEEKIHLQKQFTNQDTLMYTYVKFDPNLSSKRTWIDVWGESGNSFKLSLSLYNLLSKGNSTGYLELDNKTTSGFLIGSDLDTLFYTVSKLLSDYNGKPHILLDIFSKTQNDIQLRISGKQGSVHAWEGYVESYIGYYGEFSARGEIGASDGDSKFTLGEMACTRSAISVSAYASKNTFKNIQGKSFGYTTYVSTGQIVPFSSHGPTVDLRRKPDIAGPGLTLASAVNSYDLNSSSNTSSSAVYKIADIRKKRDYYYAEASGTSMSSPSVAGIIALILQANPRLFPGDIQKILSESAIKDNFTTSRPDSSRWGAGKVNAYYSILKSIQKLSISPINLKEGVVKIFPNPSRGEFNVIMNSNVGAIQLQIFDLTGKLILSKAMSTDIGFESIPIDLSALNKGVYMAQFLTNKKSSSFRIVIE